MKYLILLLMITMVGCGKDGQPAPCHQCELSNGNPAQNYFITACTNRPDTLQFQDQWGQNLQVTCEP